MLIRKVLMTCLVLLGVISYVDPRRVCKDHSRHCRNLGEKRPRSRCYRKSIQERCCATCRRFENPSREDCLYGDRLAWCSRIGNRYSVVSCYSHEFECCGTCGSLAQLDIKDCPYGDREIWCPYFTVDRCHDPDSRSQCCQTCDTLLHGNSSSTIQPVTGTTERYMDITSDSEDIQTATDRPFHSVASRGNTLSMEPVLGLSTAFAAVNNTSNNPPTDSTITSSISIGPQKVSADVGHVNIDSVVTETAHGGQTTPGRKQKEDDISPTALSEESSPEKSSTGKAPKSKGLTSTLSTKVGVGTTPSSVEVSRTVLINESMASTIKVPVAATRTDTTALSETGPKSNATVAQTPETVTYKAGSPPDIKQPSSTPASTTVSSIIATEIHIRLQESHDPKLSPSPSSKHVLSSSFPYTSGSSNANTSHTSSQHYVPSLEDDEDYAQASGEGDDDITIDDVLEERPRGGSHNDVERKHNGGGHKNGGGHHHKKGHRKNGAPHEVPYRYIPARREDYIFDDFRSSSSRVSQGTLLYYQLGLAFVVLQLLWDGVCHHLMT